MNGGRNKTMIEKLNSAWQRQAAAYHEAGHTVVALTLGWWVSLEGVKIDKHGSGFASVHKIIPESTIRNDMLQSMTGRAAEERWHGIVVGPRNQQEWLDQIQDALDNPDPRCIYNIEDALKYYLGGGRNEKHDEPDDVTKEVAMLIFQHSKRARLAILARLASAYWSATKRMLDKSEIWADIERLAKALLKSPNGELDAFEVHHMLRVPLVISD
jgi:hypothetical protein